MRVGAASQLEAPGHPPSREQIMLSELRPSALAKEEQSKKDPLTLWHTEI